MARLEKYLFGEPQQEARISEEESGTTCNMITCRADEGASCSTAEVESDQEGSYRWIDDDHTDLPCEMEITVRSVCSSLVDPPTSIPLHLWVRFGVLSKQIDVEIECWITRLEIGRFPPDEVGSLEPLLPQPPSDRLDSHNQPDPSGHEQRPRRLSGPAPHKLRGQGRGKRLKTHIGNPAPRKSNKIQHNWEPDAYCNMIASRLKDDNPIFCEGCGMSESAHEGIKYQRCGKTYHVLCDEWNEQVTNANDPKRQRYCPTCLKGRPKSVRNRPFHTQQVQEERDRLFPEFKEYVNTAPWASKKDKKIANHSRKQSEKPKGKTTLGERLSKPYSFRKDQASEIYRIAVWHYGLHLSSSKHPHERAEYGHPNFCLYH